MVVRGELFFASLLHPSSSDIPSIFPTRSLYHRRQRFECWFLAGGQGMFRFGHWVFRHCRHSLRPCCFSSWCLNVSFEHGKPGVAFSNAGCWFFSWFGHASLSDHVRGLEFRISSRFTPFHICFEVWSRIQIIPGLSCVTVALSLWFVTPA